MVFLEHPCSGAHTRALWGGIYFVRPAPLYLGGGVKKKRTFIANTILRFSVLLPGEGPLKRAMFALGLYLCVRSKDRKVIPGEVLRSE